VENPVGETFVTQIQNLGRGKGSTLARLKVMYERDEVKVVEGRCERKSGERNVSQESKERERWKAMSVE